LLLAALGPAMLRLAGERADGAVTAFTGPKAIADHIVPKLSQAAATSGKADPRVAAGITVCVTNDQAGIRAAMAEQFGFFGEMPSYRAMLDLEGVAGVEDVAIVGNEAAIEREVRRYADAWATELIVSLFGSKSDRVRTVELMGELARAAGPVATATA
jgi:alkanesulfonate monooxygenase SsuD/methylene tetrahydromethanopterin reductase-like flavin-dependent oxidoreductase (luciferase family)